MKNFFRLLLIASVPCFASNDGTPPGGAPFAPPAATPVGQLTNNAQKNDSAKDESQVIHSLEQKLAAEKKISASLANQKKALDVVVESLKAQVTQLEAASKTPTPNSTSNNASADEINKLQAQITSLTARIHALNGKLQNSENKISELTNENNLLKDRLNTAHASITDANTKLAAKDRTIHALQSDKVVLSTTLALRESAISILSAQKAAAEADNRFLRSQSQDDKERELQRRKDALNAAISNLETQHRTANHSLSLTQQERDNVHRVLQEKIAERTRITAEIAALNASPTGHINLQLKKQAEAISKLNADRATQAAEIAKQAATNSKLQATLAQRWTAVQVSLMAAGGAIVGAGIHHFAFAG